MEVAHYVLPENLIDSEMERFTAAVEQTREELRHLRTQIPAHAPAELPAFLDMHLLILDDNMIDEERTPGIASLHSIQPGLDIITKVGVDNIRENPFGKRRC